MTTLPPLTQVIEQYDLVAKKSFGQHFLLDEHLLDMIVRYAGNLSDHHVIEIGPGPGGLTRALLKAGAKEVVAVEKDRRCIQALGELAAAYPGRLRIVEADALAVDVSTLTPAPRRIVANLPYNVGTQLLLNWLDAVATTQPFASMTLMFQKEVAERIMAAPGGKDYGRLSVLAQWLCEISWHRDLPPEAFSPPPKIDSSVITLTPLFEPRYPADKRALEKITAAAFGQRRKMLRGALKSLGVDAAQLLEKAKIEGTRRAEELTIEEFCRLANSYTN